MKTTGRNEPCPCGSGTKYKHCCESRSRQSYFSRTGLVLGLAVAVVLAGGVAAILNDPSNDAESARKLRDVLEGSTEQTPSPSTPVAAASTTPAAQQTPQAPVAQPPGPAPAGKVWSPEHGHWHNASSVQVQASQTGGLTASASPARPTPSPGSPEPGTVWNEEHGHYHRVDPSTPTAEAAESAAGDVPVTSVPRSQIPRIQLGQDGVARTSAPAPPPGPAPEGKVWSYDHGHWHDAQPAFPSGDYPEQSPAATSSQDPQ